MAEILKFLSFGKKEDGDIKIFKLWKEGRNELQKFQNLETLKGTTKKVGNT